jgi:hypothetical protein
MYRSAALVLAVVIMAPPALAQQAATAQRTIIADVRALIAKDDFATAEKTLRAYIAEKGTTPEALEAMSWLVEAILRRRTSMRRTDSPQRHTVSRSRR